VSDWNYADVWEAVADELPDSPALVQGDRRIAWSDFDRRADGVARWLLELGSAQQDKVALYLYNCPEYLEATFASVKIGLVPVNTNYRYTDDELAFLWENADAMAVVFHGAFTERVARVRSRLEKVRGWLWVDDGSGPCPPWAASYEEASSSASVRTAAPWGRSGDDLVMLYTGGTTGTPKGVMWRQDDLFARMNATGFRRYDGEAGLDGVRRSLAEGPGPTLLPACPLMHGTGGFTASECLSEGGQVVLLTGRHFDPTELWDTVERQGVNALVIVGDPFARPMLAALEDSPGRFDLSSLVGIVSSGAMWSEPVKEGLLRHHPNMLLVDAFSSSEAVGMGASVSTATTTARTAQFVLGPDVLVLDGHGNPLAPGSDEVGVLALGGRNPLGYYKDPERSAETFRTIGNVRYAIPGDFARVGEDGTIQLLGRGSSSINTAGEKVYPEEVEEVLKSHPDVRDAVVVGVPDEQYGEMVVAVVEPAGDGRPDEASLIGQVRSHLASYKVPRRLRVVETIGRAPNGKVDYARVRRETAAWVAGAEAGGGDAQDLRLADLGLADEAVAGS
jgi:3-oxocholest-4-en-26-oate---CoA ligase